MQIFKRITVYVILLFVFSNFLNGQDNMSDILSMEQSHFVKIYHTIITSSELKKMLYEDGASEFATFFSNKVFVYKFELRGGGGYYTSSLIKVILNKKPLVVLGRGFSDDDALYRVSVGNDTLHLYGFNSLGWKDITTKWNGKYTYILLDSKWGTDYDTRLILWLAFDSPLSKVIKYNLIRYKDSFKEFVVKAYQVYKNPKNIKVRSSSLNISDVLKQDGAERYVMNLKKGVAYRVEIKGGGGYYSDCLIKMFVDGDITFAIARGFSDDKDNTLRTGLGKEVNHLIDVQNPFWTNVTDEINRYFDIRLNSKWGIDNDSKMIIWMFSDTEITNFSYSISMFPDGFDTIDIKKFVIRQNTSGENFLSLHWQGSLNIDENPHPDFIKTVIDTDGWLHVSVIFNEGDRTYSQSLKYWNFGRERFDSVNICDNSLIIKILDLSYIIDNIHFIKPDINVNRYVGVIVQTAGAGQFYGEKIHVLYWDEERHRFFLKLFEGEGEIKQRFYPKWEIRILEPLNWYSFLPHAEQPYLPHYYVWDWKQCNFLNNAEEHTEEYKSLLNNLYHFLDIAEENGNSKDIKDIRSDIDKVLKLIRQ